MSRKVKTIEGSGQISIRYVKQSNSVLDSLLILLCFLDQFPQRRWIKYSVWWFWRALYFFPELEQEFQSWVEEVLKQPRFLPTHTQARTRMRECAHTHTSLPHEVKHKFPNWNFHNCVTCANVKPLNSSGKISL